MMKHERRTMKEKRKLNKGCKMLLLFTLVVSSIFLLRPFTVKADINVNINKEKQVVNEPEHGIKKQFTVCCRRDSGKSAGKEI
jgi:hypothetical protein